MTSITPATKKNRSDIILKTENFARFTSEHTTAKPPRGCNMITTVGPLWTSVQEQCPDPWPRSPPTPASSASPLKDASLAPSKRNVMANVKMCVVQTYLLWLFTPPLHTMTKSGRVSCGISRLHVNDFLWFTKFMTNTFLLAIHLSLWDSSNDCL